MHRSLRAFLALMLVAGSAGAEPEWLPMSPEEKQVLRESARIADRFLEIAGGDAVDLPFCPYHGDDPDANHDGRCDVCGFNGIESGLERVGSAGPANDADAALIALTVLLIVGAVVFIVVLLAFAL